MPGLTKDRTLFRIIWKPTGVGIPENAAAEDMQVFKDLIHLDFSSRPAVDLCLDRIATTPGTVFTRVWTATLYEEEPNERLKNDARGYDMYFTITERKFEESVDFLLFELKMVVDVRFVNKTDWADRFKTARLQVMNIIGLTED